MGEWRKTICDLCPTGCGLEVLIEDNRIIKSRGDKENLYSRGHICRKGLNIQYHQHAQRLTHPLKRVSGKFEKISWDRPLKKSPVKSKVLLGKMARDHSHMPESRVPTAVYLWGRWVHQITIVPWHRNSVVTSSYMGR